MPGGRPIRSTIMPHSFLSFKKKKELYMKQINGTPSLKFCQSDSISMMSFSKLQTFHQFLLFQDIFKLSTSLYRKITILQLKLLFLWIQHWMDDYPSKYISQRKYISSRKSYAKQVYKKIWTYSMSELKMSPTEGKEETQWLVKVSLPPVSPFLVPCGRGIKITLNFSFKSMIFECWCFQTLFQNVFPNTGLP